MVVRTDLRAAKGVPRVELADEMTLGPQSLASTARLQNSGAATGERQANGQNGVDQYLGVEVDVTETQQRDVDQIGQRPQAVEEDHHQQHLPTPSGSAPDQEGGKDQGQVGGPFHG